jgi:hypothetical protein
MRRNGSADDQALDLPEKRLFGHDTSNADGVS